MSEKVNEITTTEEVKDTKAKKKKSTAKKTKKRVVIDRETEVSFMNNTSGSFFYRCPKTQNIYELTEYGDIDYITVGELMYMRNSHRKILNEMWIVLTDVMSDEITLDDVLKHLGLDDLYNAEINPLDIDGFILKSTDKKFISAVEKMSKPVVRKVAERAIALYRNDKFSSMNKANILKEIMENDELFD